MSTTLGTLTTSTISGTITASQVSDLSTTVGTLTSSTISGTITASQVSDLSTTVGTLTASTISGTITASQVSDFITYTSTNLTTIGTNANSSLTVTGTLTASNLVVLGSATVVNTTITDNSNIVINNQSIAGPALIIKQLNSGDGNGGVIAQVFDVVYNSSIPVFQISEGGSVNINAPNASYALNVDGSAYFASNIVVRGPGLTIPVGNTATRPSTSTTGMIRYNTELATFEGYGPGNAWGSLGGVINTQRSAFVKAKDDDTIVFVTNNTSNMIIDASGKVGIGKTSPTQGLDVLNDINTDNAYRIKGTIVIDSGCNLQNINTVYSKTISNSDLITTHRLVVNSNAYINGSIIASNMNILGTTQFNGLLTTCNLGVVNEAMFGSNIIVGGDAYISGTVYAGKIRLGTLYTTTTVNGTLAASLSVSTQLAITQLGTVTVNNLTATNPINGSITGNASYATTAGSANSVNAGNVVGLSTASVGYAATSGSATTAGSASTASTVSSASQPAITSVGTLTSLNVSGNISANTLTLNNNIAFNTLNINSNLVVASNITAQSLTLGGFTFNVTSGNTMNVVYNGSNVFQIIA